MKEYCGRMEIHPDDTEELLHRKYIVLFRKFGEKLSELNTDLIKTKIKITKMSDSLELKAIIWEGDNEF